MSSRGAKIYIVEDDRSFGRSIERLLRTSGFEVEAYDSAQSFLMHASIRHPACLLLDVRLPDIDGLEFHKVLAEKGFTLPVIFMTGHGTIPMGVQAMKDGAVDFLPKPFEKKDILSAIDKAVARDVKDLQEKSQKEQVGALMNALSPREMEVMRWVIAGKLNKQIAYALGITEKTVKVHRGRVMEKTKVPSLAELVRLAEKAGIDPAGQ